MSHIRDEINRYQEHIRRTYNDFLKTYKTENSGIKTVNQAFSQLKETKLKTEEVKDEFKNAVISVDKAIEESDRLVKTVKNNPLCGTHHRRNRLRLRAGKRHRGHQRSHLYGEFLFRPRSVTRKLCK